MRSILSPALSIGTSTIDCCLWSAAERSTLSVTVRPIKIATLQRGSPAPEDHHLRSLMTYSSPSRTTLASMLVAAEEAPRGSVIEKHDRISPVGKGLSQRAFCSAVPYRASTSMLPVSGAEQ